LPEGETLLSQRTFFSQLPPLSRRRFLESLAATGAVWGLSATSHALPLHLLPQSMHNAAALQQKRITLLEDGGFTGDAWGWQFTHGASVVANAGRDGSGAVHIKTESGDYARFLVLGPVAGKTYTLTGWVRTENITPAEEGAGAYFAASQFEFQGRPTEFTVDGKQAVEIRYGTLTGTNGWRRFSQSVKCLPTTAWFEVVAGIYRATGDAWFTGLTFIEGDVAADLNETLTTAEAAALVHQEILQVSGRTRPRAAIFSEPDFPVRGMATSSQRLAKLFSDTHDVALLNASQLADPGQLNRKNFDLLVLGYGESFPLPAKNNVVEFLSNGGDLFSTGGYAFQSPLVQQSGRWVFFDQTLKHAGLSANLVPKFSDAAWKPSDKNLCTLDAAGDVARVAVPAPLSGRHAEWAFDIPATGDGKQFYFSARLRTSGLQPAPNGSATIGVEQLDAGHNPAYAARMWFEELREDSDWHSIERVFYLVPDCVTLRVRVTLSSATGTIEATDMRLEARPDTERINTSLGWPEDSLTVTRQQLGLFDTDYRLQRVAALRAPDGSLQSPIRAEGYVASGVVGMNNARWSPLLHAVDEAGRSRGSAGALMHHYNGYFNRSSWAYFGVANHDIFADDSGDAVGLSAFKSAARALAQKCYLHTLETNYATYRDGEAVQVRVLASNYGLHPATLNLHFRIMDGDAVAHHFQRSITLRAGETLAVKESWQPEKFPATHYRVIVDLLSADETLDSIRSGFRIWRAETLAAGMPIKFHDNYFHVEDKAVFLQGTDDYLHTFIDQDENADTWLADAQGCRDSAIDVYENLMGLRGPQHRPTETWWRWVDAMLLNTQAVGGIFFPGMLVFSNTAVSDADLSDQKSYVRAFASRYGKANGIMYYLNGDLELHDPNLPDLQRLYNDFLRQRYGSDSALRSAWTLSPPEAPLGQLKIRRGSADWRDIRTLDDFHFRTQLVRRWLNALHDSIREVDQHHPVTAEFYQEPVSGIDLLTALGKLELANFGYFHEKDSDYYRFPQVCRFLDQSMRGKGINIGEFGVKTHPAWNDAGYYIEARTEDYEHQYFLSLTHYGFALGASKMQNWCWKYPADLPFEWGINYPNDMVPRDVRAFYRNSGLIFRSLRPKYVASETVLLLASDNRMGGQGMRIVEGQLNAIRLLLDANVRFGTLTDEFLADLPAGTKTIFYPLPYCPSDEIVAALEKFVQQGGQLYLSGDISYDTLRQRTRTERLQKLCGVDFVSERYPNLQFQKTDVLLQPAPNSSNAWPKYSAAPTMVLRSAGAKTLLADVDSHPVVTEFEVGKGRVIFSSDPIELHGDAQYQRYGHEFYRALLEQFEIARERITPADGSVHCFRVPTQDAREVQVLVNHSAMLQKISLPTAAGNVQLSLSTHLPGVVVATSDGVQAVESTGNVSIDAHPLIDTNLHMMAIAFGSQPLTTSRRVLLLPMGTGSLSLHTNAALQEPVIIAGEISGGAWKSYSTKPATVHHSSITIPIGEEYSLAMLLLCEQQDVAAAIAAIETWMKSPWKL